MFGSMLVPLFAWIVVVAVVIFALHLFEPELVAPLLAKLEEAFRKHTPGFLEQLRGSVSDTGTVGDELLAELLKETKPEQKPKPKEKKSKKKSKGVLKKAAATAAPAAAAAAAAAAATAAPATSSVSQGEADDESTSEDFVIVRELEEPVELEPGWDSDDDEWETTTKPKKKSKAKTQRQVNIETYGEEAVGSDGLTKKQRQNRKRAEKKKAEKELVNQLKKQSRPKGTFTSGGLSYKGATV